MVEKYNWHDSLVIIAVCYDYYVNRFFATLACDFIINDNEYYNKHKENND